MKFITYIFLLLAINQLHSQKFNISEYESNDVLNEGQQLLNFFDANDKEALILKFEFDKYLVFSKDKVYKINFIKSENIVIDKIELSNTDKDICYGIIDSLKKINPENLNITKNEKGESIEVQDGKDYYIELFKSNTKVTFSTYSPEVYIESKFPYYKERNYIVNAYKRLDEIFIDNEFEKVKNADSVFIYIDNEKNFNKIKIHEDKKIGSINFIFSDSKIISFQYSNRQQKQNFIKSSFFEDHKNEIISSNFFNEYRYKKTLNILFDKKKIYIIETRNKQKKVLVKQAILMQLEELTE